MTPLQKDIEYYFYHYHEYSFASSKELSAFQNAIIPRQTMLFMRRKGCAIQPSPHDLLMGHVIESTYKNCSTRKREIIRLRYFHKHDRIYICDKLEISTRTYHRDISEILDYAQEHLFLLQDSRKEFDMQYNFFSTVSEQISNQPNYFSNHTFEN